MRHRCPAAPHRTRVLALPLLQPLLCATRINDWLLWPQSRTPRCRYEVQGEYTIPPTTPLPSSAAELALHAPPSNPAAVAAPMGRWRLQVAVPSAELQEIIPAARLLQSATSLTPAEYERAKAAFMQVRRPFFHVKPGEGVRVFPVMPTTSSPPVAVSHQLCPTLPPFATPIKWCRRSSRPTSGRRS